MIRLFLLSSYLCHHHFPSPRSRSVPRFTRLSSLRGDVRGVNNDCKEKTPVTWGGWTTIISNFPLYIRLCWVVILVPVRRMRAGCMTWMQGERRFPTDYAKRMPMNEPSFTRKNNRDWDRSWPLLSVGPCHSCHSYSYCNPFPLRG